MNIKLSYITSVLVRVLNIVCKGNEVLAVLHLALQQFCHNFCLKIGVESSLPEPFLSVGSLQIDKPWANSPSPRIGQQYQLEMSGFERANGRGRQSNWYKLDASRECWNIEQGNPALSYRRLS